MKCLGALVRFILNNKSLCLFRLLFSFLLFLHGPGLLAENKIITKTDIFNEVNHRYGQILNPEHYPILAKTLGDVFFKLTKAQTLHLGSKVASTELHVVRSSQVNAFVVTLRSEGRSREKYLVFLTTALLDLYLPEGLDFYEVRGRILELAGVLAHELGHPVDSIEKLSGPSHYAPGANQIVEIRVDTRAVDLLREAGFPEDSLYLGLKRLFAESAEYSTQMALTNTHPENSVRLSAQRLKLTLNRLDRGLTDSLEPKISQGLAEKIIKERKQFAAMAFPIELPRSPQHLYDLLMRASMTSFEYNAYLLWFNEYLAQNVKEYKEPDELLEKIRLRFLMISSFIPPTQAALKKFFGDSKGLESLVMRPHPEARETLEFYTKPILSDLPDAKFHHRLPLFYSRVALLRSVQGSSLGNVLGFFNLIIDSYLTHTPLIASEELHFWSEVFVKQLAPVMKSTMYLNSGVQLNYNSLLPTAESYLRFVYLSKRHTGVDFKPLFAEIWRERGFWAYVELINPDDFIIPWDWIAEQLGIPKNLVKNQIKVELKNFVRTEFFLPKRKIEKELEFKASLRAYQPIWLEPSLFAFFEQMALQFEDLGVRRTYQGFWRMNLVRFYPEKARAMFQESLRDLESKKPSGNLAELEMKIRHALFYALGTDEFFIFPELGTASLEVLNDLKVNKELIQEFLLSRVLGSEKKHIGSPEISQLDSEELLIMVKSLISGGRVFPEGFVDFYHALLEAESNVPKDDNLYSRHTVLNLLSQLVLHEVKMLLEQHRGYKDGRLIQFKKAQAQEKALKLVAEVVGENFYPNAFFKADELHDLLIEKIEPENFKAASFAFKVMTSLTVTEKSDAFFKKYLAQAIRESASANSLKKFLRDERFFSQEYHVEMARPLVARLFQEGLDLYDINQEINRLIVRDSKAKDLLLEEIAWRQGLEGDVLRAHVEEEKSYNLLKQDPHWVTMASFTGYLLTNMPLKLKEELIEFLVGKSGVVEFPNSVFKYMQQTVLQDNLNQVDGRSILAQKVVQTSIVEVSDLKDQLQRLVKNASSLERVPLIELVLSAGSRSILHHPSVIEGLIAKHMGFAPDSIESVLLHSYLDVVPEQEKSMTLAYALAQSRDGRAGIKGVLELFGSVGVKFGQLAATWNLFGDEASRELSDFYHEVMPMTKHEVEAQVKKAFSEWDYQKKIKNLKKVLGSASVKTVVLAELTSGEEVAFMVKREHIESQIKTNLYLAEKFIQRLSEASVRVSNPLFKPLLSALSEKVHEEILFTKEVDKYLQVSELLKNLKVKEGEWQIRVPQVRQDLPITEGFFAVDLVDGMHADDFFQDAKINKASKHEVAELIVHSSLAMLFRYGYFDPDRHPGNWMVNLERKEVYFIDPGQLMNFQADAGYWKWDPRLTLASFLESYRKQKVGDLIHYALLMQDKNQLIKFDRARLHAELTELLKVREAKEMEILESKGSIYGEETRSLVAVVETFYQNGLEFDALYTFGAIKGLLTLYATDFLDGRDFVRILEEEIRGLKSKKLPALVKHSVVRAGEGLRTAWRDQRGQGAVKPTKFVMEKPLSASDQSVALRCEDLF